MRTVGHESKGTRTQERLRWRVPAAYTQDIYKSYIDGNRYSITLWPVLLITHWNMDMVIKRKFLAILLRIELRPSIAHHFIY
jgi:hypothetical protein